MTDMTDKIHKHFKKNDPILYHYIKLIELTPHSPPKDLFSELCDTIISQQLSGKASMTIFTRFKKLFPKQKIYPKTLLKISDEKIRQCGTSYAKVKFLKDLAEKVLSGELRLYELYKLPDEDVLKQLTKVKGIGPWTAEMFLMFGLGREDIFSHGDLGLKNAIKKLYGFKKEPTRKQIEKIVAKWSPYRTFASRILWRSLEIKQA